MVTWPQAQPTCVKRRKVLHSWICPTKVKLIIINFYEFLNRCSSLPPSHSSIRYRPRPDIIWPRPRHNVYINYQRQKTDYIVYNTKIIKLSRSLTRLLSTEYKVVRIFFNNSSSTCSLTRSKSAEAVVLHHITHAHTPSQVLTFNFSPQKMKCVMFCYRMEYYCGIFVDFTSQIYCNFFIIVAFIIIIHSILLLSFEMDF